MHLLLSTVDKQGVCEARRAQPQSVCKACLVDLLIEPAILGKHAGSACVFCCQM